MAYSAEADEVALSPRIATIVDVLYVVDMLGDVAAGLAVDAGAEGLLM